MLRTGKPLKQLHDAHPARALASVWERFSLTDNSRGALAVLDGERILVPAGARKKILALLHKPHQGLVKTKKQAGQLYFWPGMNNEIQQMIEECNACQENAPSLPKEPILEQEANRPMHTIGVDLFSYGGDT